MVFLSEMNLERCREVFFPSIFQDAIFETNDRFYFSQIENVLGEKVLLKERKLTLSNKRRLSLRLIHWLHSTILVVVGICMQKYIMTNRNLPVIILFCKAFKHLHL